MNKLLVITIVILTLFGKVSISFAIDCTPLEPNQPVDKAVKNQLEGSLNVLFKKLGSGDFKVEYQKIENDVLSKYPNADKLRMWNGMIYFVCSFVAESEELTDNEKFEKFQWLVTTWQNGPPGEKKEPSSENQDSNNK